MKIEFRLSYIAPFECASDDPEKIMDQASDDVERLQFLFLVGGVDAVVEGFVVLDDIGNIVVEHD